MKHILIIDDEEKLRTLLARIIRLEGFEVLEAGDGQTALKKLSQADIDVILCDVRLPDISGVDLTATIRQNYPGIEVIILTAYGNITDGVQAIRNGALDYIVKGDDNNKIVPLLHKAFEKSALAKRVQMLEQQLGRNYSFDSITGTSEAVKAAVSMALRVAVTDTTVLLIGETGTGKEVFAQAIHRASHRKSQHFVAINCSAFSHELLESEMFGHKPGAFTGAVKEKKGLFEEAHKGTIFLDEIGEMPVELQAKLLRVLESGEYIKVGDSRVSKADVRIIAATNRDLKSEITKGHFREDLFYRLSVFSIALPPLRERLQDIMILTEQFLRISAHKTNKKIDTVDEAYKAALLRYRWPGNIRELKNVIERSVILSDSDILRADTLPYDMLFQQEAEHVTDFSMAAAEKQHIRKVLNMTGGNKTEAARVLKIALTTLYRKIEEYGL